MPQKSYCKLTINDFNIDTIEGNGWTAPVVEWDHILEVLTEAFGPEIGHELWAEFYADITKGHELSVGTIKHGPFPWTVADWLPSLPNISDIEESD